MKRVIAGAMWSLVAMWLGAYVALFVGLPILVALPFAVSAGAFVTVDPMNRIWPRAIVQSPTVRTSTRTSTGLARST